MDLLTKLSPTNILPLVFDLMTQCNPITQTGNLGTNSIYDMKITFSHNYSATLAYTCKPIRDSEVYRRCQKRQL